MELDRRIRDIDLFDGLSEAEVVEIIALCQERVLREGEYLLRQGENGKEMYIITQGFVEVLLSGRGENPPRVMKADSCVQKIKRGRLLAAHVCD